MSDRLIVAVCSTTGPQSGKSTYVENYVKPRLAAYGPQHHLRFSDPIISFLVDGLKPLHNRGREDYEELKRLEILPGITGRDFMIAAGDTLRNQLSPSFYADIFMKRVNASDRGNIVVDDLRKMPEVTALIRSGHRILFVNVLRPIDSVPSRNDCEFDTTSLRNLVRMVKDPHRVRLMEVTWDGHGGFERARREP